MKNNGYSIFKSNGAWFVRWTEYLDGKRKQPSHKLCSVKDYPKESEVKPLAAEYMTRVGKTPSIAAGNTVKQFMDTVYFPKCEETLADHTVKLYRKGWRSLEPHLGQMRLRDVRACDVQAALDAIHRKRGETVGHAVYVQCKVTASALFSMALRLGHHPGPNPEDGTTVRAYGHNRHNENGVYTLDEVRQFLNLFPAGPVAVAIGVNAFLALRKPEVHALLPEDYDKQGGKIRIHRDTKTGNDEWLPVVAPLAKLLADGWEQINLRSAEYQIKRRIKGANLVWRGWYAFRRGMATNLYRLGVRPEEAALILRNTPEVIRKHYLRLEQVGAKVDAMARLEQAWDDCAATVQ